MSNPTAIIRMIRPVIVVAFDRVRLAGRTYGSIAHVRVELRKRVSPLIADENPSPTIPLVVRLVDVVAAVNHSVPHSVQGRIRHAVSGAKAAVIVRHQTPAGIYSPFV